MKNTIIIISGVISEKYSWIYNRTINVETLLEKNIIITELKPKIHYNYEVDDKYSIA